MASSADQMPTTNGVSRGRKPVLNRPYSVLLYERLAPQSPGAGRTNLILALHSE